MKTPPSELSPILLGTALLGAGLLLRQWEPGALSLPAKPETIHRDRGIRRAARKTRDGIARFLPSNMTGSLGRSLAIMGAGLVLVRLLDMAVDEDETLF